MLIRDSALRSEDLATAHCCDSALRREDLGLGCLVYPGQPSRRRNSRRRNGAASRPLSNNTQRHEIARMSRTTTRGARACLLVSYRPLAVGFPKRATPFQPPLLDCCWLPHSLGCPLLLNRWRYQTYCSTDGGIGCGRRRRIG